MHIPARWFLLLALLIPLAACKQEPAVPAPGSNAPAAADPATGSAPPPANPLSDARDEVLAAGKRMLAATSYHASISTTGTGRDGTIEADYVAPDRFRIVTPTGTQVVIGDTMYMQAGGRSMVVPLPPGALDQWRSMEQIERNIEALQVEALGPETVDGVTTEKYRTHAPDGSTPDTLLWVGASGYPVRVQATTDTQGRAMTSTVAYSRFNDPSIAIEAPN